MKNDDREMILIALLIISFTLIGIFGCGPAPVQPTFVSECGLKLYGDPAGFQDAEDRARAAFTPIFGDICERIRGQRIFIAETESWYDARNGYDVGGVTSCEFRNTTVGPSRSGLAHELAHVAEGCADPKHLQWTERGIWRAIEEAR